MAKKFSVPVQKGKLTPALPPTSKMQTRIEKEVMDSSHGALRRDGMTLKLHVPKV